MALGAILGEGYETRENTMNLIINFPLYSLLDFNSYLANNQREPHFLILNLII